MITYYEIQILRSKLIALTRLTQRMVDYSIKAFQLGRPEFCRIVQSSREEMNATRGWIASHGGALLAAGTPGNSDAGFVCAALRISTALETASDAAFNLARHSAMRFVEGWTPVSAELEEAGNFVNRALRLCVLSVLKRDMRHAKAVVHNGIGGQSFDVAVYLAHHDLAQRTSPHARFELVLVRCLDTIAGQIREIADALLQWHDETEQSEFAQDHSHQPRLAQDACSIQVSVTESPCNALAWVGAIPTENPSHARLTGLQQRVCELLVKNQQLRMALMAERAENHCDQLC